MTKKGVSRLIWILIAVVVLIFISTGSYLVYHYFFDDRIAGVDAPSERKDSEEAAPVDEGPDAGEGGEPLGDGVDLGDGGGGGGGEEGSDAGSESSSEQTPLQEFVEPSATLELLDFDYVIVEEDLLKITSITYKVYNLNVGSIGLDILLYLYDDEDDDSQKGFVRDQVGVGTLNYGEDIIETSAVSAYYRGNLEIEKVFKVTLIGYLLDQSYNLGSVSEEQIFD